MNKPTCPWCGTVLELSAMAATTWKRKINKDGSIGKRIIKNKDFGYCEETILECPECSFEYNATCNLNTFRYETLDKWIFANEKDIHAWE